MKFEPILFSEPRPSRTTIQVYLLGTIDFDDALRLQRKLIYDITGNRDQAALLLCQHPPLITVGRQGSFSHILCEREELHARQCPVRWVNRGGGVLFHVPGQLAIYPLLPIDALDLRLGEFIDSLQYALLDVLKDFSLQGQTRKDRAGIWLGKRLVADVGIAVRDWVTYYGAILNINPELDLFKLVRSGGGQEEEPMTSLARERNGMVNPALVRQRFIEHFTNRFGFDDMNLFTDHPLLHHKNDAKTHAPHN